jgi:molybdate transport system permease protein
MSDLQSPANGRPAGDGRLGDRVFAAGLSTLLGVYVVLIVGLLAALASYTSADDIVHAIRSPEIRSAFKLSMISCTLSTLLSLWIAVPAGYLLSRFRFRGKDLVDAILDVPIVLPPLVIGLALLILFQTRLGKAVEQVVSVTYEKPAVILAQFSVACAFAVRTMRVTFDQISPRSEDVALTLGCSRSQAFWTIALPEAQRGMLTAGTLAWARALGEFGPILVFAGATRMRTEVLPTSVYLELSIGHIGAAAAVSLVMVVAALIVLVLARVFGLRGTGLV